jgi:hypothetical protein
MPQIPTCQTNDLYCSIPDSVTALYSNITLTPQQALYLQTSDGISDRIGYIEASLYLYDQRILLQEPNNPGIPITAEESQILADLTTVFGPDLPTNDLVLFNILHDFAEAFESLPSSQTNFSLLVDISNTNSVFYQYLQTLPGSNKFDAWFEEYLALKNEVAGLENDIISIELDITNIENDITNLQGCCNNYVDLQDEVNELYDIVEVQNIAIKALAAFSVAITTEVSVLINELESCDIIPCNSNCSVRSSIDNITELVDSVDISALSSINSNGLAI